MSCKKNQDPINDRSKNYKINCTKLNRSKSKFIYNLEKKKEEDIINKDVSLEMIRNQIAVWRLTKLYPNTNNSVVKRIDNLNEKLLYKKQYSLGKCYSSVNKLSGNIYCKPSSRVSKQPKLSNTSSRVPKIPNTPRLNPIKSNLKRINKMFLDYSHSSKSRSYNLEFDNQKQPTPSVNRFINVELN